jgi:hypothetical protein
VAAFVIAGAHFSSARADDASFEILKGFDLPANDYRSGFTEPRLKGISKKDCRRECAEDDRCQAFTFNARANVCFLKAVVPQRRAFAGAVSGIKTARGQPTRSDPSDRGAPDIAAQRPVHVSSEDAEATSFEILKGFDLPSSECADGVVELGRRKRKQDDVIWQRGHTLFRRLSRGMGMATWRERHIRFASTGTDDIRQRCHITVRTNSVSLCFASQIWLQIRVDAA